MTLDIHAEARYRKLLGKRIRSLRGATSLKEAAKALNIKEQALEKIEAGESKVRFLTLEKICRHHNITSKELTEDIMPVEELTKKETTKTKKKK